jgi:hypothetical protein
VAIIEGYNHSSSGKKVESKTKRLLPGGPGTIKRSQRSGNGEDKLEQLERKIIPTSEERSLFIIAFL